MTCATRVAMEAGDFDWACLAAQQAAEKGLKAVLLLSGLRADPSHNLPGLFDALVGAGIAERPARARLNEALTFLTLAFGFSRYPNADTAVAPADLVQRAQADQAIGAAVSILAEAQRLAGELEA
jgi:HEPN domain-containing protein